MKKIMFFCLVLCLSTQLLFAGERISIRATDAHPLVGTLSRPLPTNNLHAGVVLLPMYRRTRESWRPLVLVLNQAGFTTLALDLRGHGDSRYDADGGDDSLRVDGRDSSLFNAMYLDAAAATTWLRKKMHITTERMALIGASVGCSVALQAVAMGTARVYAVVVMTPGSNYLGVPTMEHIKSWPGTPLLILSSEEEKDRGATQIYNALRGKGAELHLVDQLSIHGTNMLGKVPGVEELITHWLREKIENH